MRSVRAREGRKRYIAATEVCVEYVGWLGDACYKRTFRLVGRWIHSDMVEINQWEGYSYIGMSHHVKALTNYNKLRLKG